MELQRVGGYCPKRLMKSSVLRDSEPDDCETHTLARAARLNHPNLYVRFDSCVEALTNFRFCFSRKEIQAIECGIRLRAYIRMNCSGFPFDICLVFPPPLVVKFTSFRH